MSESTLPPSIQLPLIMDSILTSSMQFSPSASLTNTNGVKYEETNSDADDEETDSDVQSYRSIQTVKSSAVSPMSDDEDEYEPETNNDWDFKNDTAYVGKIRIRITNEVAIQFLAVSIHQDKKWVARDQIPDEIVNKYFDYTHTKKIHIKDGLTNDKPPRPEIHGQHLNDAQLDILKTHVQAMTNKMKQLTD